MKTSSIDQKIFILICFLLINISSGCGEGFELLLKIVKSPEIHVRQGELELTFGISNIDFEDVEVGSSAVKTFTIENNGNEELNSIVVSITTEEFSIDSQPLADIPSLESTTFDISFNPSSIGPASATVSIASNDIDKSPYTFAVSGNGFLQPEITVLSDTWELETDNSTIQFGNELEGATTTSIEFRIENSGPGDLNLSGSPCAQIIGNDASDFTITQLSSTIEPSGSTAFTIAFSPLSDGVKSATINIANNDSDEGPFTFYVEGIGITTAANNLVVNGELDDGTNYWRLDESSGASAALSIANSISGLSGLNSAYIDVTDGGDEFHDIQFNQLLNIKSGTNYDISFRGAVQGDATTDIRIVIQQTKDLYVIYWSDDAILTNTGTLFNLTAYSCDNSDFVNLLFNVGGNSNVDIYLDDIVVGPQ